MILKDLGMLISSTKRTNSYIDAMIKTDLLPSYILLLGNDKELIKKLMPICELDICNCKVNDQTVIDILKKRKEKYFIYSGGHNGILRNKILSIGKEFIHIHTGKLPEYRGSTAIYYSILNEGKCYATALILNENIDEGLIIKKKEYPMPKNGEIDKYDMELRTDLLIEILKDYSKSGRFQTKKQDGLETTYHVIHPVLKHIAILSCENQ